jgi:hypothetical protein
MDAAVHQCGRDIFLHGPLMWVSQVIVQISPMERKSIILIRILYIDDDIGIGLQKELGRALRSLQRISLLVGAPIISWTHQIEGGNRPFRHTKSSEAYPFHIQVPRAQHCITNTIRRWNVKIPFWRVVSQLGSSRPLATVFPDGHQRCCRCDDLL